MTSVWMKRSAVTFFAAVAITLAVPAARAATRVGVDLSPANAASGARGRASVVVRRLRGGLDATLTVVVRLRSVCPVRRLPISWAESSL